MAFATFLPAIVLVVTICVPTSNAAMFEDIGPLTFTCVSSCNTLTDQAQTQTFNFAQTCDIIEFLGTTTILATDFVGASNFATISYPAGSSVCDPGANLAKCGDPKTACATNPTGTVATGVNSVTLNAVVSSPVIGQCNGNPKQVLNMDVSLRCIYGITQPPTTAGPSSTPATTTPTTAGPSGAPVTPAPTTGAPSRTPATSDPSASPSATPTTSQPSGSPSMTPATTAPTTANPSSAPTTAAPISGTAPPTTTMPSGSPSKFPTTMTPSGSPSSTPSKSPVTLSPSSSPSSSPNTPSPATPSPTTGVPTTGAPTPSSQFGKGVLHMPAQRTITVYSGTKSQNRVASFFFDFTVVGRCIEPRFKLEIQSTDLGGGSTERITWKMNGTTITTCNGPCSNCCNPFRYTTCATAFDPSPQLNGRLEFSDSSIRLEASQGSGVGYCSYTPNAAAGEPGSGAYFSYAKVTLTCQLTHSPTISPTTGDPTISPTNSPSRSPTTSPSTGSPTISPSTSGPTSSPSFSPSISPSTSGPTVSPTTAGPTTTPSTRDPTSTPSTGSPTSTPSKGPTITPTTAGPTISPSTSAPTGTPTTSSPSLTPSVSPTLQPTPFGVAVLDLRRGLSVVSSNGNRATSANVWYHEFIVINGKCEQPRLTVERRRTSTRLYYRVGTTRAVVAGMMAPSSPEQQMTTTSCSSIIDTQRTLWDITSYVGANISAFGTVTVRVESKTTSSTLTSCSPTIDGVRWYHFTRMTLSCSVSSFAPTSSPTTSRSNAASMSSTGSSQVQLACNSGPNCRVDGSFSISRRRLAACAFGTLTIDYVDTTYFSTVDPNYLTIWVGGNVVKMCPSGSVKQTMIRCGVINLEQLATPLTGFTNLMVSAQTSGTEIAMDGYYTNALFTLTCSANAGPSSAPTPKPTNNPTTSPTASKQVSYARSSGVFEQTFNCTLPDQCSEFETVTISNGDRCYNPRISAWTAGTDFISSRNRVDVYVGGYVAGTCDPNVECQQNQQFACFTNIYANTSLIANATFRFVVGVVSHGSYLHCPLPGAVPSEKVFTSTKVRIECFWTPDGGLIGNAAPDFGIGLGAGLIHMAALVFVCLNVMDGEKNEAVQKTEKRSVSGRIGRS